MPSDYVISDHTTAEGDIDIAHRLFTLMQNAHIAADYAAVEAYAQAATTILQTRIYQPTAEHGIPRQFDQSTANDVFDTLYSIDEASRKYPALAKLLQVSYEAQVDRLRTVFINAALHVDPDYAPPTEDEPTDDVTVDDIAAWNADTEAIAANMPGRVV